MEQAIPERKNDDHSLARELSNATRYFHIRFTASLRALGTRVAHHCNAMHRTDTRAGVKWEIDPPSEPTQWMEVMHGSTLILVGRLSNSQSPCPRPPVIKMGGDLGQAKQAWSRDARPAGPRSLTKWLNVERVAGGLRGGKTAGTGDGWMDGWVEWRVVVFVGEWEMGSRQRCELRPRAWPDPAWCSLWSPQLPRHTEIARLLGVWHTDAMCIVGARAVTWVAHHPRWPLGGEAESDFQQSTAQHGPSRPPSRPVCNGSRRPRPGSLVIPSGGSGKATQAPRWCITVLPLRMSCSASLPTHR